MPFPFDATLKDLVSSYPEEFGPIFGLTDRPVQLLNVDLSTVSAATDAVFGIGEPIEELVDINFQSSADAYLSGRTEMYRAILHHRYRVPVRSVLLLLRPEADHSKITGLHSYGSKNNGVECRSEIIRLWQTPAASWLHGSRAILPLAFLAQLDLNRNEAEQLIEIVKFIEHRLSTEADWAEGVRMMRATFILAGLRLTDDERLKIFAESTMIKAIGDLRDLVGFRLNIERELILDLGNKKFGQATEEIDTALYLIDDEQRLRRLIRAILDTSSWDELLATR